MEKIEELKNFYNEKYVDYLMSMREDIKKNEKKDYYIAYSNIVKRFANFCSELDISNHPNMISIVFAYMLWGGCFSKNHQYAYNNSFSKKNNYACLGADIMLGKGVCLQNAEMLSRVFKELGYTSYLTGATVKKDTLKDIKNKSIIYRNVEEPDNLLMKALSNLLILPGISDLGNHTITLVKKDGIYRMYDPTNIIPLYPTSVNTFKYVGSDKEAYLKMWLLPTIEDITYDDFIKIFDDLNNQTKNKNLKVNNEDYNVYKELEHTICLYLSKIKPELEKIYEDNEKDIDIVCRKLKSR